MNRDPAVVLLGSGSPRRSEILTNLGVRFTVHVASVDETVREGEGPAAYLDRVVRAKLAAVVRAATLDGIALVLVADTSVIDGAAILGKPADAAEATAMIARLAGRTHEVWTRFVIGTAPAIAARAAAAEPLVLHEETVITRVTFRPLDAAQIARYVDSGEGVDKAGAYAVQARGAGLVARIEGSYTNVVGLPACEVMVALERQGLLL